MLEQRTLEAALTPLRATVPESSRELSGSVDSAPGLERSDRRVALLSYAGHPKTAHTCNPDTCTSHIHGRVQLEDGTSLPGALVHWGAAPLRGVLGRVESDAEGRFALDLAHLEGQSSRTAMHAVLRGHQPASGLSAGGIRRLLSKGMGPGPQEFVLEARPRSLHGRVLGRAKEPLADWVVRLDQLTPVDAEFASSARRRRLRASFARRTSPWGT